MLNRNYKKKGLITALKSMFNNKSCGHDGFTKEFYEHFLKNLKSDSQRSKKFVLFA